MKNYSYFVSFNHNKVFGEAEVVVKSSIRNMDDIDLLRDIIREIINPKKGKDLPVIILNWKDLELSEMDKIPKRKKKNGK